MVDEVVPTEKFVDVDLAILIKVHCRCQFFDIGVIHIARPVFTVQNQFDHIGKFVSTDKT